MTHCPSLHDKYGVRCTQGEHHVSYRLHTWMGETDHGPNTVVVWSDEESRAFMNVEREFFRLAEDMVENGHYPPVQYRTMIADLLIRLREKEKK